MVLPKLSTGALNIYADPLLGSATSPTTSPAASSKLEDSDPNYTLNYEEPQTVMALLRTRKLRPGHGVVEAEAGGVWLGADGKKILVNAYEAACQRSVTGALPGYSGSWRRHIAHSAQMLARAIAEPDYPWSGVAWR